MVDYLSPNVFIQEVPAASAPEGISASQMGVVARFQRGPANTPTKVRSIEQLVRLFGPNIKESLGWLTCEQFFNNGGRIAVVVRVIPASSVPAVAFIDPLVVTGAPLAPVPNGVATTFTATAVSLPVVPGSVKIFNGLTVIAQDNGLGVITGAGISAGTVNYASGAVSITYTVAPVAGPAYTMNYKSTAQFNAKAVATTAGTWANVFKIEVRGNANFLDEVNQRWNKFDVLVEEPDQFGSLLAREVFEAVQFTDDTAPDYVTTVMNDTQTGSAFVQMHEGTLAPAALTEFAVQTISAEPAAVQPDGVRKRFKGSLVNTNLILRGTVVAGTNVTFTVGAVTITDDGFGNLTGVALDPAGKNHIDYTSGAYDFTLLVAPALHPPGPLLTVAYKFLPASASFGLAGGTDGVNVITRDEVTNPNLQAPQEGVYAFEKLQDIVNVCIPDFAGDATVSRDLCDYADTRRDRFMILTVPVGSTIPQAQVWVTNLLARRTKYAAVYYPWVRWFNTAINGVSTVPPLGVVAGVFARTDANKNVSKAPAGTDDGAVVGAVGPEVTLTIADRDRLFPRKIDPIADSAATGFAVWGDRTLSDDTTFRFIGPTRLFMFMEEFCYLRLQPFLFENNGPNLWAKIRMALTGDFSTFFHQGYFAGQTKAEAFRITCDDTNNTQEDITAGVLNIDVGIAPNFPAEFIVVRFQPLPQPSI